MLISVTHLFSTSSAPTECWSLGLPSPPVFAVLGLTSQCSRGERRGRQRHTCSLVSQRFADDPRHGARPPKVNSGVRMRTLRQMELVLPLCLSCRGEAEAQGRARGQMGLAGILRGKERSEQDNERYALAAQVGCALQLHILLEEACRCPL